MISVILIWIYMAVTTYLVGFGLLTVLPGIKRYCVKHQDGYIWAGMAAVTVYAQIFSLFAGVGLVANLILLAVCVAVVIGRRRQLTERLQAMRGGLTPGRLIVGLAVLLLLSFGASRGIIHYDTGLYHAQSIRWIEEFGIVPGLGNLHLRLAYNSASFSFSALYSMRFLGGASFHAGAGFLALIMLKVCLSGIGSRVRGKLYLADPVRVMAVYYLLNIFNEMISPASDYFMVLLFFFVIIRWLELLEQKESSPIPFMLLSLMAVFLLTIKLSAALVLLLALKPALQLFKQKRLVGMAGWLGLGTVTVLPYLIRNVILSGWPLYPSTFLHWFRADWTIPQGVAQYDFREIQVWGRGYTDVAAYDRSIDQWIGSWFAGQTMVDKLFILAAAGTGLVWLVMLTVMVWRRKWGMADHLLVSGTVSACFYFWLFSAPLIRYGCVYVWLAPIITYGYLYLTIKLRWPFKQGSFRLGFNRQVALYLLLVVLGCYKTVTFGRELWLMIRQTASGSIEDAYLIKQKDYENFPTVPYELKGYTFYYAQTGDRTGYDDFPASPDRRGDIFRGMTIEEGFKWPREE